MKKKFLIEVEAESVYSDQTEETLDSNVQAYIDMKNWSDVSMNNTMLKFRLLCEHVDVERLIEANRILCSDASPETIAAISCIGE